MGAAIIDRQSGITEHGGDLRDSADAYDATDAAATAELCRTGGGR